MVGKARSGRRLAVMVGAMILATSCGADVASPGDSASSASPPAATATSAATVPASATARAAASPTGSGAIAPAGRIAYEEQSGTGFPSIRIVGADGSGDTPLADGSSPAWSPDGDWLAFECNLAEAAGEDRYPDLCAMRADGSDSRVLATEALRPRWSPDGQWILFSRSAIDFGDTWMMRADGSGVVRIGDGTGDWSPDGSWIMLIGGMAVPEVTVVSADGSGAHAFGTGWNAIWSPDSSRIASTWTTGDRTEIRAVAISTGTVETLLEIDGAVDAMAWLADDRIVIAKDDQLEADATSSGLFLADLSSGQVQPMVSGLRLWGSGITGHLAASPDEAWVAFVGATVEDWDGESSDLYVASLDGEFLRLTVSGAARRPVWQPR